jgi:hypothetical protein
MRVYNLECEATISKVAHLRNEVTMRNGSSFVQGKNFYYKYKPSVGGEFLVGSNMSMSRYRGESLDKIIIQFHRDVKEIRDRLSIDGFHLENLQMSPTFLIKPDYSDYPTIRMKGFNSWKIISIPEQKVYSGKIEEEYKKGGLEFSDFVDKILCLDCIDLEKKKVADLPLVGNKGENRLKIKGYKTVLSIGRAEIDLLVSETGYKRKFAEKFILIANNWLKTISAHRNSIDEIPKLAKDPIDVNRIAIFINNFYSECSRIICDSNLYGAICADSGGDIIAVNRNYNFNLQLFDYQDDSPNIQRICSMIRESEKSQLTNNDFGINDMSEYMRSTWRKQTRMSFFVDMLQVSDNQFISIIMVGINPDLVLIRKIFRQYETLFSEICPNADEMNNLVSIAKSEFIKKVESLRNKAGGSSPTKLK